MFYKRVLGTGLVAMALSLGAQAMQKGGFSKGYDQEEQSEESSESEEEDYGVALPSKGASQESKSVQGSAPVAQESKSVQVSAPVAQQSSICQEQVVESCQQVVTACEQSADQSCQQEQQFDSCQQIISACQQDAAVSQKGKAVCNDNSQSSQACQDQVNLNKSCSNAPHRGALVSDHCGLECSADMNVWKLIKHNKFSDLHAHGHRINSTHNFKWKEVKKKSWNHLYLSDFNMHKVEFKKTTLHDVYLKGRFDKVHFGKDTQIDQSTFSGDFLGVTFAGATITNTRFENARFAHGGHMHLINSSFAGARFENVSFENVTFNQNVSFEGAKFGNNVSFAGVKIETNCGGFVMMTDEISARFIKDIHGGAAAGMTAAQWAVNQGLNVIDSLHGAAHGAVHAVVDGHHSHHNHNGHGSDSDSDSDKECH